jgi:hypothetical protein
MIFDAHHFFCFTEEAHQPQTTKRSETDALWSGFSSDDSGNVRRPERLQGPAMTQQHTLEETPHQHRFRLLADLCLKLGEYGCSTCLVHPPVGGPVLYVNHRDRSRGKLGVAAIEHGPGTWAYAWDGQWRPAQDTARIAQLIARTVLT